MDFIEIGAASFLGALFAGIFRRSENRQAQVVTELLSSIDRRIDSIAEQIEDIPKKDGNLFDDLFGAGSSKPEPATQSVSKKPELGTASLEPRSAWILARKLEAYMSLLTALDKLERAYEPLLERDFAKFSEWSEVEPETEDWKPLDKAVGLEGEIIRLGSDSIFLSDPARQSAWKLRPTVYDNPADLNSAWVEQKCADVRSVRREVIAAARLDFGTDVQSEPQAHLGQFWQVK